MTIMKKILIVIIVLAFFFVSLGIGSFLFLKSSSEPKDNEISSKVLTLKITQGMNAKNISSLLYSNEIIKNKNTFYLFARFPVLARIITGAPESWFSIKRGVCKLDSSMSVAQIYKRLSEGLPEQKSISIPEGLTMTKIARRFEDNELCSAKDFMEACTDKKFLESCNLISDTAEGFLFPDTYSFSLDKDARYYVSYLIKTFFEKTAAIPEFRNASKEEILYLVTLSSIIEREYRVASEAPLISSVFHNRLKDGIGLYSCATVEYIITEILGLPHPDVITYEDLEIQNPYNTYKNAGLPPGAICNPGLTSLKAAAEPTKTDYYYFRLTDAEKGLHVFTRTLEEHEKEGVVFKTKMAAK